MKQFYLLISGLLLLGTGCTPQIYTSATTSYPPRPKESHVILYEEGQNAPPAAEPLGKITVEGSEKNNSYGEIVELAKATTNHFGGNSLSISEHVWPDTYLPRRLIRGQMLLLPDSLYAAICDSESRMPQSAALTYKGSNRFVWNKPRGHTLFLNAGYAFVLTKLFNTRGATGDASRGLDINGGYQWTAPNGLGIGVRYSGYFTSLDYTNNQIHIGLHYIAPEFVLRQEVNDRWTVREAIGVGYAYYRERIDHLSAATSGVGYHLNVGVEYKITRYIGIGVDAGLYSTHFGSMVRWLETDGGYPGILRVSLNGGLRCYF